MLFPSNILAGFANKGGSLTPADGVITVAPALALVATVGESTTLLQRLTTPGADVTTLYASSFLLSVDDQRSNSGTVTRLIATLAPGIWTIEMSMHCFLDTPILSPESDRAIWRLVDGGNLFYLGVVNEGEASLGFGRLEKTVDLNIPSTSAGYQLSYVMSSTTAAQHMALHWAINARRLG